MYICIIFLYKNASKSQSAERKRFCFAQQSLCLSELPLSGDSFSDGNGARVRRPPAPRPHPVLNNRISTSFFISTFMSF